MLALGGGARMLALGAVGAWALRRRHCCACISAAQQQQQQQQQQEGNDDDDGDDPLLPSRLLTIVVTTSPIRSHPSTDMLETLLRTFSLVPELAPCARVIVCDGFNVTDKPQNPKYRRRRFITPEEAGRYAAFGGRLRALLAAQEAAAPPGELGRTRLLQLPKRAGFALALRAALRHVSTPYVMVVQHDWAFLRPFPLRDVLRVLTQAQTQQYGGGGDGDGDGDGDGGGDSSGLNVKYVGFASTSSLDYAEQVSSRCRGLPRLQSLAPRLGGLPLLPLLFWYDKTHICEVAHYRHFVFGEPEVGAAGGAAAGGAGGAAEAREAEERGGVGEEDTGGEGGETGAAAARVSTIWGKMCVLRPGDFIEDTLGHVQLDDIKANGMGAHAKYGTFLFDDGRGEVLSHLDGRRFLTGEQREARGMPREGGRLHVAEALAKYGHGGGGAAAAQS